MFVAAHICFDRQIASHGRSEESKHCIQGGLRHLSRKLTAITGSGPACRSPVAGCPLGRDQSLAPLGAAGDGAFPPRTPPASLWAISLPTRTPSTATPEPSASHGPVATSTGAPAADTGQAAAPGSVPTCWLTLASRQRRQSPFQPHKPFLTLLPRAPSPRHGPGADGC